jgi:hypothetical protein
MKKLSILLFMCLLGTISLEAQKTPVPVFKTVQVRPGVIKVPSFSLPAGTASRLDLRKISAFDPKAITEIAQGTLVGTVEVNTTTSKLNIELTPKNFLSVKGAELQVVLPVLIRDKFYLGDHNLSKLTSLTTYQYVQLGVDVTSGKQYLIRIPVTVDGTVVRSFQISATDDYNSLNLFTTSFAGSQEIAFTLVPQNTGTIFISLFAVPTAGGWSFSKIIISEL